MRAICHCRYLRITDQRKWEIHLYSQSIVAESQNGWGWRASPPNPLLWQGCLDPGAQDSVQAPPPGVLQVLSCPAAFWMGVPQHWWVKLFFCTSCWITHLQKLDFFLNFFKYRMVFNFLIWMNNFFFYKSHLLRVGFVESHWHCIGLSIQDKLFWPNKCQKCLMPNMNQQ